MTEEKESIGFRTRAKEIQDKFAKVQAELSRKKVDWESLRTRFDSMANEYGKLLMDIRESHAQIPEHMHVNAVAFYSTLMLGGLISGLGIELTETHKRLTECEKAIRELKLAK